ncbi:MAG: ferritin family protein [bacterium]|nr:ferritin family protein [bacterium]
MNVFEYAMKMETDGRKFYLDSAEKAESPALKKILLQLADDEVKHYAIFKAMKDGEMADYKEAEKTTILKTVKNVFENLRDEGKDLSFSAEAKKIWEEAREVERQAEEFYREKANELDSEEQKRILNRIADEEHRHWVTMNNVIQFLDRPNHWLEDAEWSNIEDY